MGALHKLNQMHNKTYLFMPIESTARELDYKLNIARHFCAQGLDVMIGHPPFIRDELKYKNYRGIFLEKGLNPDPDYYSQLSSKGVYLYDLSDEGASNPVYSVTYSSAVEAMKNMRILFLWGESQRIDLTHRNSDPTLISKYKVIGNPGFDLCYPKYKKYNEFLQQKDFPSSYILINTNFACHNSYGIEEQLKACSLISPSSLQLMLDSYQKEEEQFGVIREWLHKIIKDFPQETFIIRPHPYEREIIYRSEFGNYKNVIISKHGNVNYVISNAKLMLHKDCTTALQSYLMGVPVISLGGNALSHEYHQFSVAFSEVPNSVEETSQLIRDVLENKKWEKQYQKEIDRKAKGVIDSLFHDIGVSTQNLVNSIKKDAENIIADLSSYKIIDSRPKLQKIKNFIRKFMPLYYKMPKASRLILIKFTKHDIMTRLQLFEAADPLGIDFVVKKVFPNTFQISRKT